MPYSSSAPYTCQPGVEDNVLALLPSSHCHLEIYTQRNGLSDIQSTAIRYTGVDIFAIIKMAVPLSFKPLKTCKSAI